MDFVIYILFFVGLALVKVLTPDTPGKYIALIVLGIVYVFTIISLVSRSTDKKELKKKDEEIKRLEYELNTSISFTNIERYEKAIYNIQKSILSAKGYSLNHRSKNEIEQLYKEQYGDFYSFALEKFFEDNAKNISDGD